MEVSLFQTKNPEVVTVINEFWDPEPWFVASLTVTGALLLLLLTLPLWLKLFRYTNTDTNTTNTLNIAKLLFLSLTLHDQH